MYVQMRHDDAADDQVDVRQQAAPGKSVAERTIVKISIEKITQPAKSSKIVAVRVITLERAPLWL